IDTGSTVFSAADSRGNTYSVDVQAASNNKIRTVILSAHNITGLVAGDTITVTHPSTAKRALSANEFSGLAKAATLDKTAGAGANNTTTPDSGPTATTAQAAELLIGSIGVDGPSTDTFTPGNDGQTGTYTALTRAGTTGGSDFTVDPEF